MPVAVIAVSIFRMNNSWAKEADFIIPHQRFFIDAVERCKLANCEKLVFFLHFDSAPPEFSELNLNLKNKKTLDCTVTVWSMIRDTGDKCKTGGNEFMEKQNIYVKPVTLKNILKFAVPTIAMTVFMAFYTMVDGLFVANLIGTAALSAINLTAPVVQLVTAISTMLATGGSAVIMRKAGAGKEKEAREDFTFLILVNVIAGFGDVCAWISGDGACFCRHGFVGRGTGVLRRISGTLPVVSSSDSAYE